MGKGLSELQKRILAAARRYEREKGTTHSDAEARLWLFMPDEVHDKALQVCRDLENRWAFGPCLQGAEAWKFSSIIGRRVMIEERVESVLDGCSSVIEYLHKQFKKYASALGHGVLDPVLEHMMRVNGVHYESGRAAWLYVSDPDRPPWPTTDEFQAVCEAAPVGGAWCRYQEHDGARVSYNHLLAKLFGFPLTGSLDAKAFDVGAIGAERYNVARASLQRACFRLEQRGLVHRIGDGRHEYTGVSSYYDRAGFLLRKEGQDLADRLLDEAA